MIDLEEYIKEIELAFAGDPEKFRSRARMNLLEARRKKGKAWIEIRKEGVVEEKDASERIGFIKIFLKLSILIESKLR